MQEDRTRFRHSKPVDSTFRITIIAQDASVHRLRPPDAGHKILTTAVRIPAEWLEPGPRSHRFHVVDYDETASVFEPPARLMEEGKEPGWPTYVDAFRETPDKALLSSPEFRALNVFAVASRTLATFESALGRRVPWSFGARQLYLVPRAMVMENAYYQAEDEGIYFGYFTRDDGDVVQTSLSHDIIAHETTHALLDGLKPRYLQPSLPDQFAFHEGLADIVALLSVFSMQDVVEEAIAKARDRGSLDGVFLTPDAFTESLLFTLAEQWPGDDIYGRQVLGLRTSVLLEPGRKWLSDPEFEEPHLRGEILVAAVMRTLLGMWLARMALLAEDGRPSDKLVAEEGAKCAGHLLRMLIRAIDYMPPVELEYADIIDAILISDAVVAPIDEHGYRSSLKQSFESYGVEPLAVSQKDTRKIPPVYENISATLLRSSAEEAYRFIWNNATLLGIDRQFDTIVDQVVPCVRAGPDGVIVNETAVSYVQSLEGTAAELAAVLGKRFRVSTRLPREPLQVWGGGTIVFDQFGRVSDHQQKPLKSWARQNRRLDYLLRTEPEDSQARFGFAPRSGRPSTAFHGPRAAGPAQEW